jgi:lactoylglutathione lyase
MKIMKFLLPTCVALEDPKKSLEFYTKHLGMTLLSHRDFPDAKFSLYFLGTMPEGATEFPSDRPVLELTHNHGTENDEKFQYYSGNEADRKGFGHLGFLVDDVTWPIDSHTHTHTPFHAENIHMIHMI